MAQDSDAVLAIRRDLDAMGRENADRLALLSRKWDENHAKSVKEATDFQDRVRRLAKTVRERAQERLNPAVRERETLSFDIEDSEPDDGGYTAGHPAPYGRPLAEQAPAQPPTRQQPAGRRADENEDFSRESWLR